MLGDRIRVQQGISSSCTDEELLFVKQQGVDQVFAWFDDAHTDYDSVMCFTERVRKAGLTITDGGIRGVIRIRSFSWDYRRETGRSRNITVLTGFWRRRGSLSYT